MWLPAATSSNRNKAREVSGRAEAHARRKPGDFALAARRLDSRAFALLTRRNGTQRSRRDSRYRFLLLIRRQVLNELLIRFFKLGVLVELLKNAGANAIAAIDLVDVL